MMSNKRYAKIWTSHLTNPKNYFHKNTCQICTGGKSAGGMKLTTQLRLVSRLEMNEALRGYIQKFPD